MDQLTYQQVAIYGLIANLIIAFLLGLVLLFLGRRKNKTKLGLLAIPILLAGTFVLGIFFYIPAFIIFMWLIFKKTEVAPNNEPAAEPVESSDDLT